MTIKIIKNPNIGISILTIFPIPSLTPAETINAVKIINNECQKSKLPGEEITLPN